MKTGLSVLALGVAMIFGAVHAHAADLINEDDMSYTVIVDGDMEVPVEAKSELQGFCDACSVQLSGSEQEPISVNEASTVIISEGKLVVEN
ncbi:MAG: hypothetical protein ACNI26_16645 [Terasakiella sp.]|uniref:hypothetical protein n=1 Tax=unclassified Terasakiella TaxID=2614952 RepID=UPI003AFF9C90